jgi:hypothetical protein
MGPLYLFRSDLDLTFLCAEKGSVFCVGFLFARYLAPRKPTQKCCGDLVSVRWAPGRAPLDLHCFLVNPQQIATASRKNFEKLH